MSFRQRLGVAAISCSQASNFKLLQLQTHDINASFSSAATLLAD
jgi:hypothetical protein